jgi:hypothetical protein
MGTDLRHLRGALEEAITILEQDTTAIAARVDHTLAVLYATLVHHRGALADPEPPLEADQDTQNEDQRADGELDDSAILFPPPHRLANYRQERGMHIPAFTAFLGITHVDYVAVVHRQAVDRRLRDQIAYKLGVRWQEIAEFMSETPPKPQPQPVPIPAPDDALPPHRPWYLVDDETGRVLSGPHATPVPENGYYIGHLLAHKAPDLVVLHDFSGYTREDQLPPGGYTKKELQEMYPDWDFENNTYAER